MLLSQIGTIQRWVAVGAAVASAIAALLAISGSVAFSRSAPSPVPVNGTPAVCGSMVDSWGAATADDVRVQLIRVQRGTVWGITRGVTGTSTPLSATPAAHVPTLSVELEIANLGQEMVRVEPRDVVLTTCSGNHLTPATDLLGMKSPLGSFSPGETRRGEIQFRLAPNEAPVTLSVAIQEKRRTGAQISCPLALDLGTVTNGAVSAGCSAQGGRGQSGAAGVAGSGMAPTATTGAGQ